MRALVICLLLTGCATTPDPVVVKVPVPLGCLGDVPARPVANFGTGGYPGEKVAAQTALLDSLAFQAYATQLEVAMAGCDPLHEKL